MFKISSALTAKFKLHANFFSIQEAEGQRPEFKIYSLNCLKFELNAKI